MDWGTLLLAVGLVYLAYEAGRWSQREDIKKQAEIHVMIMKAFEIFFLQIQIVIFKQKIIKKFVNKI